MIQALPNLMSFEEFTTWLPQDGHYELIDGVAFEMQPTGEHEDVTEFISTQLTVEAVQEQLLYKFPRRALLKAPSWGTGYLADVLVLDLAAIVHEPLWQQQATITQGSSVKLVVEVMSTNWETDYARKLEDYESMGIPEYWIVDYRGLGGKKQIGSPKQPTFSVYSLMNGEYKTQQFRGSDRILSAAFPKLALTAEQVFTAGR
ncbi:MAG: Uma2 family endonuclease [Pegethrix bostrychoides GSE-TBD4-15B]|jgi:Uma2 family endonuclease|uniref:Uma2 family endonuclease n=1 Tax=Pegethrix bostrychoides GSE-TBD4-15B TaxID=2839662 RepID=A0A951U4U9_9CYAN|nr:Uma2 family endonuclease [Pegethrix bostrychoides GSE-TBD4-15B]